MWAWLTKSEVCPFSNYKPELKIIFYHFYWESTDRVIRIGCKSSKHGEYRREGREGKVGVCPIYMWLWTWTAQSMRITASRLTSLLMEDTLNLGEQKRSNKQLKKLAWKETVISHKWKCLWNCASYLWLWT